MKFQVWAIWRQKLPIVMVKDWLSELKQVFEEHINYVVDVFGKETKIKVMKPQGPI